MKLSILIPIFNERRWLEPLWRSLKAAPLDKCVGIENVEIVIVDDGSTDGTREIIAAMHGTSFRFDCGMIAPVKCELSPSNGGKGAAVRRAIALSTGDILIIQDADLEYSPQDFPILISPFREHGAEAVLGSRFAGYPRRVLFFWHSVMNGVLTTISNALNNINLTDMETGYKAIRGPLARRLRLTSNRFGIEPELVARLARARCRIYEVPISYQGRTYREGKKIRPADGLAALFHILRFGVWDTEPYLPGLSQTLNVLETSSDELYLPLLREGLAIAGAGERKGRLRILEVGAGIGTLTSELLRYGDVVASDLDAEFVQQLEQRFQAFPNFEARRWDATAPWAGEDKFDIVVACNVLEHLRDDSAALKSWRDLLRPGGVIVLIVPQYGWLYSAVDRAIGHYRRYTPSTVLKAAQSAGLEDVGHFSGNPLGILGWLLFSRILNRKALPQMQVALYARLKWLLTPIEKVLRRFAGLNLVYVIGRPAETAEIRSERRSA